jgi:hypothetical protein
LLITIFNQCQLQYESNARFVRWSDGSLQLLIGNEVLDLNVQDARHDQAHLFLRHGKVYSLVAFLEDFSSDIFATSSILRKYFDIMSFRIKLWLHG